MPHPQSAPFCYCVMISVELPLSAVHESSNAMLNVPLSIFPDLRRKQEPIQHRVSRNLAPCKSTDSRPNKSAPRRLMCPSAQTAPGGQTDAANIRTPKGI